MNMPNGLGYGIQTRKAVIGTKLVPVTLTNAYTGNTGILNTAGVAAATFYVDYTPTNAANSIQIKIEGSPDYPQPNVTPDFYQDVSMDVSAGVATLTLAEYTFTNGGTTDKPYRLQFTPADQQLRISIKETVSAGSAGTAAVTVLLGPNY